LKQKCPIDPLRFIFLYVCIHFRLTNLSSVRYNSFSTKINYKMAMQFSLNKVTGCDQFSAAPQIAAPMSGDCTFEVDECGWSNVGTRDRLDDLDWDRISGQATRTPTHDHTLGTEKGKLHAQGRVNALSILETNVHCWENMSSSSFIFLYI
jgi:hypothetical protein